LSQTNSIIIIQWIIIDSKVFDISRFANLHPGGLNVLLDEEVAGQDATKIFFSLHRHEVLLKPSYARLQIGQLRDESQTILAQVPGELSTVPYGEPTWITKGYYSPYFKEVSGRYPPMRALSLISHPVPPRPPKGVQRVCGYSHLPRWSGL
jgi:Cytochrome b5-like Heme/Steroid binding domain